MQTATFDNSKGPSAKVDEDALPAMPTWAGAVDKRVEDPAHHHEDVEMEPLNPHGQTSDRNQGAATPMHPGAAYSDYPPDRGTPGGYRGFNPTDPYARRSPGPAAALAATQDPYGRRSPGMTTSPVDPYARRSPALPSPAAVGAVDPYGRRSPGPGTAYSGAQDLYGRRSPGPLPGPTAPIGAANPYDHQPYHQPYGDYTDMNNNSMNNTTPYHGVTSPSPVAAYKPPTTYSPMPMPTPSTERTQTPGFTRQPSFGSSQYPPTYTSQPPYRGTSPSLPSSPPPPFPAQPQSQGQYTAYGGSEYAAGAGTAAGVGMAVSEPERNRPPSLLQSGRQPAANF